MISIKNLYSCLIDTIKRKTDEGQFQYLTGLKGPQEGTYLYTTQFLSLRSISILYRAGYRPPSSPGGILYTMVF